MRTLSLPSWAKINLNLRVVGLRPDGFHEIESLVARVSLADTVTVMQRQDGQLTVSCDDPQVPTDERNLALRAARELRQVGETASGRESPADSRSHKAVAGAHIEIAKRIPLGAGLGGGSSNAAATLRLLNQLWGLELTGGELADIGARVGSDVPLFFSKPVCIIRGRGERVWPVREKLTAAVLLMLPRVHSATAAVYRAWDEQNAGSPRGDQGEAAAASRGESGATAANRGEARAAAGGRACRQAVPLDEIVAHLADARALSEVLCNDLEAPAFAANPELARVTADLRAACPGPVHMTGSGAGFFMLDHPEGALINEAERCIRPRGLDVRLERTSISS